MAAPKITRDIADYLTNTVGLSDVSIGQLNPTPLNQYAVVEYPGASDIKVFGTQANTVAFDQAMLQVMARHTAAETARDNSQTVYDALNGLAETTINGVVYSYIEAHSRPRIIDRQEDGSCTYICEFKVQARR